MFEVLVKRKVVPVRQERAKLSHARLPYLWKVWAMSMLAFGTEGLLFRTAAPSTHSSQDLSF